MGAGLTEATARLKRQGLKGGGICTKGMNREAVGKNSYMGGLKEWFKQDWVDIGSKKKGGGFNKCGRKSASGSKRKYPKCVPAAKASKHDRIPETECRCKKAK